MSLQPGCSNVQMCIHTISAKILHRWLCSTKISKNWLQVLGIFHVFVRNEDSNIKILPPILDSSIFAIPPSSFRRFVKCSPESSRIFDDSIALTRTWLTSPGWLLGAIQYPPNTSPVLISNASTSFSSSTMISSGLSFSCSSDSVSTITRNLPSSTTNHWREACAFRDIYTTWPCFLTSISLPPFKSARQTVSGASCARLVFMTEQKSESVRSLIIFWRKELLPDINNIIGSSCMSESCEAFSYSLPVSSTFCRTVTPKRSVNSFPWEDANQNDQIANKLRLSIQS